MRSWTVFRRARAIPRLVSVIGFALLLALGGLGQVHTASAQTGGFVVESIGCGAVTGVIVWDDVPLGGYVNVVVRSDELAGYNGYTVRNFGGDESGELKVSIPFSNDDLDDWYISVTVEDEFGMILDVSTSPLFDRECSAGSVSPGGTGEVESEPTDARSGVTSEPEDAEAVEDPDDDGRVQVP
jgi:hypothetical protein